MESDEESGSDKLSPGPGWGWCPDEVATSISEVTGGRYDGKSVVGFRFIDEDGKLQSLMFSAKRAKRIARQIIRNANQILSERASEDGEEG